MEQKESHMIVSNNKELKEKGSDASVILVCHKLGFYVS